MMGKDFENPFGEKTPKGEVKMMSAVLDGAVFPGTQGHRRLIAYIVGAALFSTLVGVLLGVMNEEIYWWDHKRIVFSFTNPIYFAFGGLAVALGAFFLLGQCKGRWPKGLCWMIIVFGVCIVLGARARNGVLFTLTFILTYVVLGRRQKLMTASLVGVAMLGVVIGVGAQLSDRLDELSSRRLSLWEALIEENVGDMTVSEMLLGVGDFEQTMLGTNDALVAGTRFNRAHGDNAYLDLFLSLGLTGVALFVCPLLFVGGDLVSGCNRRDNSGARDSRVAVATLVGLLVQGVVVSNIPSLGNLMNVLCMSLVMGVWGRECQLRRVQTKLMATAARVRRHDLYVAGRPLVPAEPVRASRH